jgi:hypothetical protein
MKPIGALGLVLATLLTALLGRPAPAGSVIVPSGFDERIRLDWEAGRTRRGRPVIQGYILNDSHMNTNNVILLVETLDGSGAVVAHTTGFVVGMVHAGDRGYFEVPLKVTGTSYRVRVTSLDWRGVGGGGGM